MKERLLLNEKEASVSEKEALEVVTHHIDMHCYTSSSQINMLAYNMLKKKIVFVEFNCFHFKEISFNIINSHVFLAAIIVACIIFE